MEIACFKTGASSVFNFLLVFFFLSHQHLWFSVSQKKFLTESYILYWETRFWAKVAKKAQTSKNTRMAKSGPKILFPNAALKILSATVSGHLLYIFDYALYQIYITTDPRFQMGLVGGKVHRALRSKLHQLLIWTRAPLQWRVEGAITLSVIFPLPNFWTASNKKNLDYIDLRSVLRSPDLRCYHPFNDLTIAKSMSVPSAS